MNDLISRKDAITKLRLSAFQYTLTRTQIAKHNEWRQTLIELSDAINDLKSLPSVDAEHGEGMWRMTDENNKPCGPANAAHWLCTSCNGVLDTYHKEAFAHCPFCGAIMSIDYEWLLKKGGL